MTWMPWMTTARALVLHTQSECDNHRYRFRFETKRYLPPHGVRLRAIYLPRSKTVRYLPPRGVRLRAIFICLSKTGRC
jgi:hypothetical protein